MKPPFAARLMHDTLEIIGLGTLLVIGWTIYHLHHLAR